MLDALMSRIADLEKSSVCPEGINIDAKDWSAHYSSFGPDSQEPSTAIRRPNSLIEQMTRPEVDVARGSAAITLRAEMKSKSNKYLPCHYFDYIGGTSTGG